MKKIGITLALGLILVLTSCSNNFSNGERIGFVTAFSEKGVFYNSWEGHLNTTQTGMNSAAPFDFSIDNDKPDNPRLVANLDSAARFGYKVKLTYTGVKGWNWFNNRGETNNFVHSCDIIDRNPTESMFGNHNSTTGRGTRDTIYLLIYKDK